MPCDAVMCCAQVFVEYVTNDGYHHGSVDNSLVRSFERLMRKLLTFRREPAVVLMQFLATDVKINKLPFYATGVLTTKSGPMACALLITFSWHQAGVHVLSGKKPQAAGMPAGACQQKPRRQHQKQRQGRQ